MYQNDTFFWMFLARSAAAELRPRSNMPEYLDPSGLGAEIWTLASGASQKDPKIIPTVSPNPKSRRELCH